VISLYWSIFWIILLQQSELFLCYCYAFNLNKILMPGCRNSTVTCELTPSPSMCSSQEKPDNNWNIGIFYANIRYRYWIDCVYHKVVCNCCVHYEAVKAAVCYRFTTKQQLITKVITQLSNRYCTVCHKAVFTAFVH